MALGGAGDVEQAVDLHGRRFGSELAQLRVSDAFEGALVVRQRVEAVQAFDPEPQRPRCRRAWGLLQAIEWRGGRPLGAPEQRVEGGAVDGVEARGDLAVERFMRLGAQVADEAVEGAEGL
jgi:hypothetical protein